MLHGKFDHFQTWANNRQHFATRWPNARNMLRPTMLRYVALKCCDRLAGAWEKISSMCRKPSRDNHELAFCSVQNKKEKILRFETKPTFVWKSLNPNHYLTTDNYPVRATNYFKFSLLLVFIPVEQQKEHSRSRLSFASLQPFQRVLNRNRDFFQNHRTPAINKALTNIPSTLRLS